LQIIFFWKDIAMKLSTKPFASLSLDLDNKWSYMKTHGDDGWATFPSYLDIVVPRVLRLFDEWGVRISFFIVGQDAAIKGNHAALRSIATDGHEIGNHSFNHEPWLHLYSEEMIEREISLAEENIENATGKRPVGFRGPGFSLSENVIRVLAQRGYLYDASTFPTFIGPLARMYYFMTSKLTPDEKEQRRKLFGTLQEGFRPNKPYRWSVENGGSGGALMEIPVTTMPFFRIPFHVSYILYLGMYSRQLALSYFRTALFLCRINGVQPSLLLHPLDFMGCDDTTDLSFFPAMGVPNDMKIKLVKDVLKMMTTYYEVVPLQENAVFLAQSLPSLATYAITQ
jgi:peptidoglycan/xylan/chitin deacetylase (PgdA/CDA1 family)